MKIEGIKSVDFKIVAKGHGVVNWNGNTTLIIDSDPTKKVSNHTLPKLRGYSSYTGEVEEKTNKKTGEISISKCVKKVNEIDFKENPLYVSANCIRHHLFKDQQWDIQLLTENNIINILSSPAGLIRGYAVTASQNMKKTAILLEDFVDILGNGNFEQFSTSGERNSTSIFSKTTFGDTEYRSYGSIVVEDLQFISLDQKFGRAATTINKGMIPELTSAIEGYLNDLNLDKKLNPKAVYHSNYVRRGSVFSEGEEGILLNSDAISLLVEESLTRLKNLIIRQAKGYLYVDELKVDYNDSNMAMRIKRDADSIQVDRQGFYAVYYEGV